MAHWFGQNSSGHSSSHHFVSADSVNSHELDYGEFFTEYIKSKQRSMDRQRHQAAKVSNQMKRDQDRS
ncbi:hypothetical protein [Secundilactobacillus folii]|uniref:Uncharacterized protein n=1 Tax=Secundilactobacillus folii TaxID=2678357 RepID=A0A7X3C237_9LACO|nr:hypothetical protein [Secundilactobacillus folii]MTV81417.1 hypothetical protein [Secundilactobacillus folii]